MNFVWKRESLDYVFICLLTYSNRSYSSLVDETIFLWATGIFIGRQTVSPYSDLLLKLSLPYIDNRRKFPTTPPQHDITNGLPKRGDVLWTWRSGMEFKEWRPTEMTPAALSTTFCKAGGRPSFERVPARIKKLNNDWIPLTFRHRLPKSFSGLLPFSWKREMMMMMMIGEGF